MSAVPKWRRLLTELLDDANHGAPIAMLTLEPDECVRWIDEEAEDSVAHVMQDAIGDLWADGREKELSKLDTLSRKIMLGTMTADELLEYRDIHRAALIDYCSAWARRKLEEEIS